MEPATYLSAWAWSTHVCTSQFHKCVLLTVEGDLLKRMVNSGRDIITAHCTWEGDPEDLDFDKNAWAGGRTDTPRFASAHCALQRPGGASCKAMAQVEQVLHIALSGLSRLRLLAQAFMLLQQVGACRIILNASRGTQVAPALASALTAQRAQ